MSVNLIIMLADGRPHTTDIVIDKTAAANSQRSVNAQNAMSRFDAMFSFL